MNKTFRALKESELKLGMYVENFILLNPKKLWLEALFVKEKRTNIGES